MNAQMNQNLIKLNQGIVNQNLIIKPLLGLQIKEKLKGKNVSKKTDEKTPSENRLVTAHTIQFSCKLLPIVNESLECKYLSSTSITAIL